MTATIRSEPGDTFTFARVVEAGSFTGAGKLLGLPTSTVSRRVARLEDQLGVRLLQRTTRALHLTDAGRVYHARAEVLLREFEDAQRAMDDLQSVPRGLLRVTAGSNFRDEFWALTRAFIAQYPEVNIDLELTPRTVDIVQEGFDVAIRGGRTAPDTPGLIAKKLGGSCGVLVASPEYIERAGAPATIEALADHDIVICRAFAPGEKWRLRGPDGERTIALSGRVTTNDLETAKLAAMDGFGITQHFASACAPELSAGTLVEVLPGTCPTRGMIWAIYPSRRHLSPTVRAFMDFVTEHFNEYVSV